jgi:hypothetical protein
MIAGEGAVMALVNIAFLAAENVPDAVAPLIGSAFNLERGGSSAPDKILFETHSHSPLYGNELSGTFYLLCGKKARVMEKNKNK